MPNGGIDPNNPTATSSATASGGPQKILQLLAALKQFRSRNAAGGQPPQGGVPGQGGGGGGTPPVPGVGAGQPSSPGGGGGSSPTGGMLSSIDPVGTQTFKGFQGLAGLLQQWTSRKSEKEHVEAANIAMKLRKAMDDNDTAMVHEILNDKNATKVLNKVYKGWLTKSQEAQKPGKEPDPAVSGFEKGVTDYEKGKAQQKPGAGRTEGGYLLPQAGAAQQLGGIKAGEELKAAQADPKRTLDTQLSSDEMRKAERAKVGLDSTPATDAKLQEVMAKLQQAQLGVKKAELELQSKQTELQATGERTSAAMKKADIDLQRSQIALDIERTRLLLLKEKPQAKGNQPPVATVGKLTALEQAESYVQNVMKTRAKGGFTGQDVQTITGLLRQAGATSTAQSLPGWYGRNMPTWLGGKGEEDVAGMLETIQQLKSGIQETIDTRYPGWQGGGKKASAKADEPPDEGEEDDSDIVVSPEEVAQ